MYMVSLRLVQMAEHPEIMVFSFLFFFWGGRDKGTQWHSAYKFHHTNQKNNLLIWNMAMLNIWTIKVTSRKPWAWPLTLPIHRISLHYSTKEQLGWLLLKFLFVHWLLARCCQCLKKIYRENCLPFPQYFCPSGI